MRGRDNQVWVTSALTNEEARNALVLGCSLQRTCTSRAVAVIVSPKIDGSLQRKLAIVFNPVILLQDPDSVGLAEGDWAKLTAIVSLRSFEQAAYLSPGTVAVRNADRIFTECAAEDWGNFLLPRDGSLEIFLFKPDLKLYEGIMKGLEQQRRNGAAIEDLRSYVEAWMGKQSKSESGGVTTLDEKYTKELEMDWMLLGNEKDVSLVNLGNVDPLESPSKLGKFDIIGKVVQDYWQKIYKEDVQPLLEAEPLDLSSALISTRGYSTEPIAIVGMSCRFPGSNNLEEFWNLLFTGGDGISTPPPFRWLREQSKENKPESRKTNAGFLSTPVDQFDAKFFGLSPKEMLFMDPQHRLLHELVWEGLEDACINPQDLKGTPGSVFIGSWTNDYKEILMDSADSEFFRNYMGNSIGAAAARISHLLQMIGPSVATESGCASAMVAVHMACRSLQMGESNMALACGVNLLVLPFGLDEMPMMVSPEGRSKTFCEKADGFARAEGCGVLVLKRLSDAVRDNDNIWALVRGSAMVQEGISKSMGTPTIHCESLAMIGALRDAGVGPEEVSYVEAHRTGTVVGDPLEVAAIAKAYNSNLREEPLIIGSVKTNVGHTESCSGITGIIKVALAMHHSIIPAHRNLEKLNPAIDLDAVPARIPLQPVEWKWREGKARIAGVSSFGITGTDTHIILEESPQHYIAKKVISFSEEDFERPLHLLKFSAKSDEALNILLEKYQNKLGSCEEALEDIAHSLNAGRANFHQRAAIIAKSKEELVTRIKQRDFLKGEVTSEDDQGNICFLFTGQGSQYPGMAKQLHSTSPVFKMHFELCANILEESYSIDIKQVLWDERGSDKISRTIYSQTSIFCVEYALLKLWESWGVRPDFVLGHSLGEFAAAVCAGILKVEDALKLVAERSRLIDQLTGGKMLVVRASEGQVENLLTQFGQRLDYAAINSSEQTVVAGDSKVVLEFSKFCTDNRVKSILLEATHAFHSKHMEPIMEKYKQIALTVRGGSGNGCGYISGLRGRLISGTEINAEYWAQHTREKVSFLEASQIAVKLGCRTFIEIGPQPVLSALTMLNNAASLTCLPSLKKKEEEWKTILNSLGRLWLKGFPIDWQGFDQFYDRKKVPTLPSYPFIGKKFWPDLLAVREGGMIHPLLGSCIPNASATKLFKCGVNLSTHQYITDHTFSENILVPGAGYLEMCLAAGLATLENSVDSFGTPSRPMKVEDLRIEAPLALQEGRTTEVQTVVELNTSSNSTDWNDMSVKIFHRVEGETSSPSWLSHAKATFSPLPSTEEQQVSFDVEKFRRRLQLDSNENQLAPLQAKLAAVGLKFGPSFKRLEKVWKREEDPTLLAKVSNPSQVEGKEYDHILHPTLLDAMIQSIMFCILSSTSIKKKLFVPIRIGKFVWLGGNETEDTYIYAYDTKLDKKKDDLSTSTYISLLLDGHGKVLAYMSGVEFIDTTVKAIEAVLEQQTTALPDLWEEVWRPKLGPNQLRQNLQLCNGEPFYDDDFRTDLMKRYSILDKDSQSTFVGLQRLVYYHMLRAMYELGWEPPLPGTPLIGSGLAKELGIMPQYLQYFGYILQVLEDEGILKREGTDPDPDTWRVIAHPPTLEQIEANVNSPALRDLPRKFKSTVLLSKIGASLGDILTGKQSPLPLLFPEESKKPDNSSSAASFYVECNTLFKVEEVAMQVTGKFLAYWKQRQAEELVGEKFVVRILEIGAGTGTYTKLFLKLLQKFEIKFEFTFTDISESFFPPAQKIFAEYGDSIKYKKLNIEEDPIAQGFVPGYYDYVRASEVIHATRDIRESLRNVNFLLKPMGRFDVQETTRDIRFVTYLFGVLEGYWRFTDKDLRSSHCSLSTEGWRDALGSTGYEILGTFPTINDHNTLIATRKSMEEKCCLELSNKFWLVFHQESSPLSNFLMKKIPQLTNRQVVVVQPGEEYTCSSDSDSFTVDKISEKDFISLMQAMEGREVEGILYCWSLDGEASKQEEILQPYFYLAKSIQHLKQRCCPRLLAITNGVVPLEDTNFTHFSTSTSTIWGFTKSLGNETAELNCRVIDMNGDDEGEEEDKKMQIFYELWNDAKETQVAYAGATRYTPKFVSLQHTTTTDLKLPRGTDRFQLVLPETNSISDLQFGSLEPYVLGEEEVEIQVKASALNFKDVLNVLKPSEEFKDSNAVGFDFAGLVKRVGPKVTKWTVGDEVFGVNMNGGALPTHVKLKQDEVFSVGNQMTLCEAATLPAVFTTSYHCLVEIAMVTSNDTVLIHTASGGVGLSAIQLCRHVGAKIICTAGSTRKQNYLRSMGIQHVFNSRNTKYGEDILKMTGGRGVDVVLNSLTSEGFKEATLMACARGARFVEMSKLSIWEPEEVKRLRPDVEYTIVDLSSMNGKDLRRLMNATKLLADKNVISPIPYVRFDGVNIRGALQYLQKAKHIGKVVCVMPEMKQINGQTVSETPMFNPKSTYLITGGLGGIGLVVCQWMVEKGAKYIMLAGRNPPNSSTQEAILELNSRYNAKVIPVQLDVSNFSQCRQLLQDTIPEMGYPRLRGIMHCAGTLHDGLIQNQDWSSLSSTLKTKVDGTLNLHELTKDLPLEHFVLFSSVVALFGNPGQSNHAAGNHFEDTFAHYRNSIGLPATTINWGQWGQVGVATEVNIPGLKPLSNLQGTAALEFALKSHRNQTCATSIDSFVLFGKLHASTSSYVDERVWNNSTRGSSPTALTLKSEQFWELYDSRGDDDPMWKLQEVRKMVGNVLKNILKLDESDTIHPNQDFQEMGVDSLMFIEIKNALQVLLGDRVTVNASALRESNSVEDISTALMKLIEGNDSNAEDPGHPPTFEEVDEMMREDCQLSEHICAKPDQTLVAEGDIQCVLLTGSTGTLGPYLLRELTSSPQISSVICLIRPTRNQSGEQRLEAILEERDLLKHVDMSKVSVVSGDVAKPRFGVGSGVYKDLSEKVEAVVHSAASVQHLDHYRKHEHKDPIREVNVQGVKNVLEFSCSGKKLKHIFHFSSIVAVLGLDVEGVVLEEWPELGSFQGITTLAYPITKFIGEFLLKEAITRGIPAKAHRFPLITGDSKTGRFLLDQNHIMLRYLHVLKTCKIPSVGLPMLTIPVDTCAEVGLKLFLDERCRNDIINVTPDRHESDLEFVEVARKLGYDVDVVEFSEFAEDLQNSSVEDSPFALFKEFYQNEETYVDLFATNPVLRRLVLEGESADAEGRPFHSRKLARLVPDFQGKLKGSMDCIYRDLLYAKGKGWLNKYASK